ncbi:MAG TPA: PLDc N-terminal domain-containing protein, partial [Anaerolineae bacterium]
VGLLVLLATVLFWFVALFDCLGSKHPDKLIWFLVILTLNAFGAAAWFLYAKKQIAVAPSLTAPRAPLPARIGQTYTRGYAPPPNDPSRHYPTPKRIRKHKQSLTKWHILAISIWSILLGMCSCLTIIIIAANWNNPTLR